MKIVLGLTACAAALAAAAPASAQDWHRWNWDGPRPGERIAPIAGPGVPMLIPELRDNPRGRIFVMRNFDFNRDGLVEPREADAANRAFLQIAGDRRDRFDWDRPGGPPMGPVPPIGRPGGWDRGALHGYGFRQTARGATFRLDEDVLFATDSDVLRPGAIEKLRPLAGYLSSNPGVRVAIDGYTDARGSDAHNQDLSERRAASVRNALAGMGADRARFSVVGHGERDPIAPNTTSEGMRQNRRVEVTLLGQRATQF
jgi:outer membrane protein OmpA-like peptidoglycan-associated protein